MHAQLLHVLRPKWQTARTRTRQGSRGRGARILLLGVVGSLFWILAFGIVLRLLRYFRNVPELGALRAAKLLGLMESAPLEQEVTAGDVPPTGAQVEEMTRDLLGLIDPSSLESNS